MNEVRPEESPEQEPRSAGRYIWERALELALAALATAIAALTLWACYYILTHRQEVATPLSTLLTIAYGMSFAAMALLLFSARLAVPRLRLAGGRIIGVQGLWAFGVIYAVMLLIGLRAGTIEAKRGGTALLLGIALSVAWRSTFKRRE